MYFMFTLYATVHEQRETFELFFTKIFRTPTTFKIMYSSNSVRLKIFIFQPKILSLGHAMCGVGLFL